MNKHQLCRGEYVKTWFDTGAMGMSILWGKVITAGPYAYTVRWESGIRNRIRQGQSQCGTCHARRHSDSHSTTIGGSVKAREHPRVDGIKIHWDWEMESQEADNCQLCFVSARISYATEDGDGTRRLERLSSASLGGIDPSSELTYKREIEDDQIADLRTHLEHFGIVVRQTQWDRLIAEART